MKVHYIGTRFVVVAALVALGGGVATVPISSQAASAAAAPTGSSVVNAPVFSPPLTVVGQVNLASLAASEAAARTAARHQAAGNGSGAAGSTTRFRRSTTPCSATRLGAPPRAHPVRPRPG